MTKKKLPPEDEHALFERAMLGVVPTINRPNPKQEFVAPVPGLTSAPKKHPVEKLPPAKVKTVLMPAPAAGNPGIDKRQADRLRRGRLEIDGRLDLHGMKQQEAHHRLHAFVLRNYDQGARCLLLITGKGTQRVSEDAGFMPDRDIGVLKRNVPRWLQEPGLRDKVLSVSEAQARHGGSGALYVLLRRKKS
jgi:DNA-nicking Smr family endonuclease